MFDKSQSKARWLVLALACGAMLGSYYCYDNPTALKKQMEEDLSLNDVEYNLLYSVYSFPNIVLPFFGGILVDKLGVGKMMFLFVSLILVGQLLFSLAFSLGSYWLALVGRVVFGLGGESLCVAGSTLLALWFQGNEVAFSMGLNLSVARLGSVINDQASPYLYSHESLTFALFAGAILCAFSLANAAGVWMTERWAKKQEGVLDNLMSVQVKPGEEQLQDLVGADDYSLVGDDNASDSLFAALPKFSRSFWLVTGSCVVVYGAVLPFNNISGDLIQEKYGMGLTEADSILAIPFFISACASPFLGGLVDKIGNRITFLNLSVLCLGCAHGLLAFTDITPYVPMVIIGASYCVYAAAIWPSVSLVVDESLLGTAYGTVTAVQNAGLAVMPILVGLIKDNTSSYEYVEIFFSFISLCGLLIGGCLASENERKQGLLNKSQSSINAAASTPVDSPRQSETWPTDDMDKPLCQS